MSDFPIEISYLSSFKKKFKKYTTPEQEKILKIISKIEKSPINAGKPLKGKLKRV